MKWKKADPIPRFAARLTAEFGVSPAELEALAAEARAAADDALAFAKESPLPDPGEVDAYVYA